MELPRFKHKGIIYLFDYRLRELRTDTKPIKFICLNNQELETLNFAIENKSQKLIKVNMEDLSYKL